ncbi:hypothetical protein SISSUDRAFT_1132414 [Sistotremastrum suecicum HHB10207 ss-3]|uniref:F-box domain-containing protein n=1 Tax=Sistotremastrum suecicum HHB10207 ss-3 TaxID=1314776 RepID=A0A165YVG3_9AGAM|nr:hypothetical protein SISSUDRAFT_1132414 [Sistotremastrum suecicum HHB10207 ss-3]
MDITSDPTNAANWPPRVVASIMWHYIYVEDLQSLIRTNHSYSANRVSRVCKSWRDISLSKEGRSLWSSIHLGWSDRVINMFLERSRGESEEPEAVLSIAINQYAHESGAFSRFKDILKSSRGRIGRLNIKWDDIYTGLRYEPNPIPPDLLAWLSELFEDPMRLENMWEVHLDFFPLQSRTPSIPNLMALPSISHVRTRHFSFDLMIPEFSCLTKVDIAWPGITADQIMIIMRSTPMLETAMFQNNGDFIGERPTLVDTQEPPIKLQSLKNLIIGKCYPSFAEYILRSITCPASSKIELTIYREDNAAVLSSLPPSLEAPLASSMYLDITSDRLHASREVPDQTPFLLKFDSINHPHYHVAFDDSTSFGSKRPQEATQLLVDLASIGDFSQLTRVGISIRHLPHANDVIRLLDKFSEVEDLTLKTQDLTSFLTTLGSSTDGIPLCPVLQVLDIRGSGFDPYQLKDTLAEREDMLSGLEKLIITYDPHLDDGRLDDPARSSTVDEVMGELKDFVHEFEFVEGEWTSSSTEMEDDMSFEAAMYDFEEYYNDPDFTSHDESCMCRNCIDYVGNFGSHLWAPQ